MTHLHHTLVDTHCHLNMNTFDEDRQEVLQQARTAGIERILIPGIDLASSRKASQLARVHGGLFAAVGVHPHESAGWTLETGPMLRMLSEEEHTVAIGEIGLDYYRDHAPHDVQQRVFAEQLELAADLELPVVIHQRESLQAIMPILAAWIKTLPAELAARPGVLHAFSGDCDDAREAARLGFYIGIGGPLTFRNADRIKRVVAEIPLSHLVLETDAPYLAPQPMRGKRNEPGYLVYTARAVAAIKTKALEDVLRITTENANHLFQWSDDTGDTLLS